MFESTWKWPGEYNRYNYILPFAGPFSKVDDFETWSLEEVVEFKIFFKEGEFVGDDLMGERMEHEEKEMVEGLILLSFLLWWFFRLLLQYIK